MAGLNHQVRIIAGQWRGRKLNFSSNSDNNDLRPTSDRIRETLFNWLAPVVHDSSCLDAFAGSGILGWEALSRGAQHCHFMDISPLVKTNLLAQQTLLSAQNLSTITQSHALETLQQPATQQFDVVFLDPPFRFTDMTQDCVDALVDQHWLEPNAFIYVEQNRDAPQVQHSRLKTYRHQHAGQVQYGLLQLID